MDVLKAMVFAVLVGWVPWTCISMVITHFFHTDPDSTYLTVGVVYAGAVWVVLILLTIRR